MVLRSAALWSNWALLGQFSPLAEARGLGAAGREAETERRPKMAVGGKGAGLARGQKEAWAAAAVRGTEGGGEESRRSWKFNMVQALRASLIVTAPLHA